MYEAFKDAGLKVEYGADGRLTIAAEGQVPVEVSAERLLDPAFMQSVGMTITLDQTKVTAYQKVAEETPDIKKTLETRSNYCYVQVEGNDLGLLGQASLFVAGSADMWFAEEQRKLHFDFLLFEISLK